MRRFSGLISLKLSFVWIPYKHCSFLTLTPSSMFCHPLIPVVKHQNLFPTHHLVQTPVHDVQIQLLNISIFSRSRQHVKELSQRVRTGRRKMFLVCMEYCSHPNYILFLNVFLHLTFRLDCTLWEAAGAQTDLKKLHHSAWWMCWHCQSLVAWEAYQHASSTQEMQQKIGKGQSSILGYFIFCVVEGICQYYRRKL